MNIWIKYMIIAAILVVAEQVYFRIADRFNIIDKPNERSSHSTIVLRGGGIILTIALWIWSIWSGFQYPWLLAGVTLAAGISFIDDIHSLPDSLRLIVQFASMFLIFYEAGLLIPIESLEFRVESWLIHGAIILAALVICVGATNIINFMDGINGITAGYSIAVVVPLLMLDVYGEKDGVAGFVESSLLIVVLLSLLVFSLFNFRPKGKAKCFAGDVGSIGIAFIMLFAIGRLIVQTGDVTYLIFLLVYGVDGCLTIIHRIMLHENLGQAHRKHAYQLMANELKIGHVKVSLLYMAMQLVVSLGFVFLCPDTIVAHWIYLVVMAIILGLAYVAFMKKFYYLHEEYLSGLQHK